MIFDNRCDLIPILLSNRAYTLREKDFSDWMYRTLDAGRKFYGWEFVRQPWTPSQSLNTICPCRIYLADWCSCLRTAHTDPSRSWWHGKSRCGDTAPGSPSEAVHLGWSPWSPRAHCKRSPSSSRNARLLGDSRAPRRSTSRTATAAAPATPTCSPHESTHHSDRPPLGATLRTVTSLTSATSRINPFALQLGTFQILGTSESNLKDGNRGRLPGFLLAQTKYMTNKQRER